MIFAYKLNLFSIYGVSVLGACFHSIGQVIAITFIYQQYFMQLFLPVLLALSIVSGLCIALLTAQLLKRLYPKIQ
jgi:heptaprenyl diphosphate synthase